MSGWGVFLIVLVVILILGALSWIMYVSQHKQPVSSNKGDHTPLAHNY